MAILFFTQPLFCIFHITKHLCLKTAIYRDGFVEPKHLSLPDFAAVAVLSPGSGKLGEAAIRLFAMLRLLDEAGVDEIIAEPVSEQGVGAAIMDRLRRAAGRG